MKILVGLSGGVDSSVAALLLKQQGHQVIGATMKIWGNCHKERGVAAKKDQYCFLYRVTQEQLKNIILPPGNYTKDEIRRITKENGVDVIFEDCQKSIAIGQSVVFYDNDIVLGGGIIEFYTK